MADRSLTYVVKIDTNSAASQAAQLRAAFQAELQHIQISLLDPGALNSALSATQTIRSEYAQIAQQAQQAVQTLGQANANQLVTQYGQILQEAQQTAQSMQQAATAQPQRPQQPIGGGQGGGQGGIFDNIGNSLLTGAAGYFSIQGARYIAEQAAAFAEFGTQVRRTEASFKILSGSAGEADARIRAIKDAGGGAIDTLHAMELANQGVSLHLANTAKGFDDLTKAGREIALVSPVIHDVQSAISELGLASANLSFRRLDQLGLTTDEVKAKMKELQAANSSLDDSQAFLAASIDTLKAKYEPLLQTQAAQASGLEKLKVAFSDLWAEMAKGPVGQGVDKFFGGIADSDLLKSGRAKEISELDNAITELQKHANASFGGAAAREGVGFYQGIKAAVIDANKAIDDGIPGAQTYKDKILELAEAGKGLAGDKLDAVKEKLQSAQQTFKDNAAAVAEAGDALLLRQAEAADKAQKALSDRLTNLSDPVVELGRKLDTTSVDNFFKQLQDGLAGSAGITATENNHLAEMRQKLVDIGNAVKENKGNVTEAQRQQAEATIKQIEALNHVAALNEKLQAKDTGGQNLDTIYARLNAIVAQTDNTMKTTAADAKALGDAIAQSGSASADQLAQIDQLAAQANQADFSRIAESLRELNSGSLDAVPGIDSLREKLTSFYDILASGQGLTSAQAAEFAQLTAEAAALGGSTSALAALQDQLGYSFLNSHEYVAALVQQVANLEALYGAGAIGADQFAGGMNALTGELYSQLAAAGALTPRLAQLLTMLNAVKAAASGGAFGPPAPGQFFGGFGGGGTVNTGSAGYLAGQAQAQAAAAAARAKADAGARAEAIKEQAKAAKQAAGATQNAFEDAAKGTQKAFEAVVDDMRSALQKVEGLFSPSKVTAEDMALSKAGLYQPKADELLRQVKSAAENPADQARFAAQIAQAREALQKIGVAPAENLKAMAAQLEQAWSTSALFSNKDNLKLINADAVKFQLNLAAKAKEGQENIYEYFGATLDGVKEKFAAKDPTIVDAVAAELQSSQDKNLKALGKSLQDGVQGAVDKALSNLAAAEAGFSKGGGGGGGGGSVSVGAIPTAGGGGTWIDKVSENVGKTYQNFADLYMPQPVTPPKGSAGGLYGPPAPAGMNAAGLQANALTGTLKVTAIELDPSVAGTGVTALVNKIAAQFDDPANRAVLAAKGPQMSSLIQAAFTELATYQPMAAPLVNELVTQFNDPANRAVLAAKGPEMSSIIQSAFTELAVYGPMAGPFVNEVKAQFDDPANKGVEAGIGTSISDNIQHGIKDLAEYQDMTINLVQALATQFLNEQNVTNYKAIGSSIRDQIILGVGNAEDITKAVNADALPKETEGADGKTKRKSAFDFGPTVDQVNQSLSRSFGATTDTIRGIGDSIGTFIGFGMTDHDFSTTSAMVIGSLSASFTGDQARAQLLGVGSAISGAIFAGFQSSLAYQPWLSTLVQTVVSQAMESMTNSVNDSLQTQAVGL